MVNKKALGFTSLAIIVVLVLLSLLIAGNNSLLQTLAVYIVFLLVAVLIYRSPMLKPYLLTINKDNLGFSVALAVGISGAFYLLTRIIPGFSIGLPNLPQSIGSQVRQVVIFGFAPFIESIFFQSIVFALLLFIGLEYLNMKKGTAISFALFGQAIIFALSHVAAYISGFYNYPDFVSGVGAFQANIGSFIAAFTFAVIAQSLTLWKKVNNLVFTIIFHALLNIIIFVALSLIFS